MQLSLSPSDGALSSTSKAVAVSDGPEEGEEERAALSDVSINQNLPFLFFPSLPSFLILLRRVKSRIQRVFDVGFSVVVEIPALHNRSRTRTRILFTRKTAPRLQPVFLPLLRNLKRRTRTRTRIPSATELDVRRRATAARAPVRNASVSLVPRLVGL